MNKLIMVNNHGFYHEKQFSSKPKAMAALNRRAVLMGKSTETCEQLGIKYFLYTDSGVYQVLVLNNKLYKEKLPKEFFIGLEKFNVSAKGVYKIK